MSDAVPAALPDLYARIVVAVAKDAGLADALVRDLPSTLAATFGVVLPKPAALERAPDGFRLTYDGRDFLLPDPREAGADELNDAELDLVSGGGADCDNGTAGTVSRPGNLPSVPMPRLT